MKPGLILGLITLSALLATVPGGGAERDARTELRSTDPCLEATADAPPTFEVCTGQIRPGSRMTSPYGCTFNFVFTDGTKTYIGTAGHCADIVGQRVSTVTVGSFGAVVWKPSNVDFALIEVDANKLTFVNPTMCAWGGPDGTHTGTAPLGTRVVEYGWGVATSPVTQARSRIHVLQSQTTTSIAWHGVGSGGDSGAPITTETGLALGIHTAGITPVAGVVFESGPYIGRILTLASQAGFAISVVPG